MPYQVAKILEVTTHGPAATSFLTTRQRYDNGIAVVLNGTDFLLAYLSSPTGADSFPTSIEVIKGKASGGASSLNEYAVVDSGNNLSNTVDTPGIQLVKLDGTRALVIWRKEDPVGGVDSGTASQGLWAAVVTYTGAGLAPAVGTPTQITFVGPDPTRWFSHTAFSPVLRPDGSVVMTYVDENVALPAVGTYTEALRVVHLAISGSTVTPTPSAGDGYLINTDTATISGAHGDTQLANLSNGEMLSRWRVPGPTTPDPTRWAFLHQTGNVIAQVGPTTAYNQTNALGDTGRFFFAIMTDTRLREFANTNNFTTGSEHSVVRERAYDMTAHTVEDPPSYESNPADTGWAIGLVQGTAAQTTTADNDIVWFSRSRGVATPGRYLIDIVRQRKNPYSPADTGQIPDTLAVPVPTGADTAAVNFAFTPLTAIAANQIVFAYDLDVTYTSPSPDTDMNTVQVMITSFTEPPLRWRQRPDCLTPGSATPCPCYYLPSGVVCIPPFWIWLTSSVQFGGRVGPLNTFY